MSDVAVYFDNKLERNPFIISKQNGIIKIIHKVSSFKINDGTITLGYQDTIDSLRRLKSKNNCNQRRIELLFGLNIGFAKSDSPKIWKFTKRDIIGDKLSKNFLKLLRDYENGNIVWKSFYNEIIDEKNKIIEELQKSEKQEQNK